MDVEAHLGPVRLSGTAADPLLKWQGGKRALVPLLSAVVGVVRTAHSDVACYAEPFLGAGGSLLGLLASGVLGESVPAVSRTLVGDGGKVAPAWPRLIVCASDASPELANLWRQVRTGQGAALVDRMAATLPREITKATYASVRRTFNRMPHEGPMQAARLLWLNRAGYNGLHRVNADGDFNAPVGSADTAKVPDLAWMQEVGQAVRNAHLTCGDYRDLRLPQRSIIYCDPPYLGGGGFTAYTAGGFVLADHVNLARRCKTWVAQGHVVLLSNADCEETSAVYAENNGWAVVARPDVARSSGATPDRRGPAPEVLLALGLDKQTVWAARAAAEEVLGD